MFAGVILDTWTTWAFVSQNRGFEQNPILAPLTRHSPIWIPIYLLCRPLLVPFLPELCRFGFSVYFGLMSSLTGANNLAGSFYGRYFLIEVFGFQTLQGTCILFAVVVFIWAVWRHTNNAEERKQQNHDGTLLDWNFWPA